MYTHKTVIVCLFLVALTFLVAFFFMRTQDSSTPAKGVEVLVHSGKVNFQSKDGQNVQSVNAGETLQVQPDLTMALLSTPSVSPQSQQTISSPTPEPIRTGTLSLTVVTHQGEHVNSATGSLSIGDSVQPLQLDAQGKSIISNLSVGNCTVRISHPDLFDISSACEIREGTNEIQLIAFEKARFSALVKNPLSNPIQDAQVALAPVHEVSDSPVVNIHPKLTDRQGFVTFAPLVAGKYVLDVSTADYLPHRETIKAHTQNEPRQIVLRKQSLVKVLVQDQDKKPIYFAKVTLQSRSDKAVVFKKETSESTGMALFENIPPGHLYEISAEHVWYFDSGESKKEIRVQYGEESVQLTLQIREYAVSGIVFEEESRQPVPGVEVVAFSEEQVAVTDFEKRIMDEWEGKYNIDPIARTKTNSMGEYRLTGLKGGAYTIGVSPIKDYVFKNFNPKWNFGAKNPTVTLEMELEVKNVNIGLQHSWSVSGKVLLQDGTPLEKADINIRAEYQGWKFYAYNPQVGFRESQGSRVTTTQADGTFRFEGNSYIFDENFKLYINAFHTKYRDAIDGMGKLVSLQPGQELQGVDLIYEGKAVVRGHIRDTKNQPLADAIFNLGYKEGVGYYYNKPDGSYEAYVKPGQYNVWASKDGYKNSARDEALELAANQEINNFDFVLEEGKETFEGIVVEEEGKPAPRKRVVATYKGGYVGDAGTDNEGKFVIKSFMLVPKEISVFEIVVEGDETYDPARVKVQERWAQNIRIVLQKYKGGYASLAGVVLDGARKSVPQFEIQLIPTSQRTKKNHYEWMPVSHPDGAFQFQNVVVVDGPFLVAARSRDHAPAFSQFISLRKDEVLNNITLYLQEDSFSLVGQVVDQQNQPVGDTRIVFRIKNNPEFKPHAFEGSELNQLDKAYANVLTDSSGQFRVQGIPVSGGELWIYNGLGDIGDSHRVLPISGGSKGEERNLGSIVMEAETK